MDTPTANTAPAIILPPLNKLYIIGIWISTVLWSLNTIAFTFVCYVLFFKPNSKYNRGFLGSTSLLLYLCVTLHIAASLRQEIEAFVLVPPGAPPSYSIIYFAQEDSKLALMKTAIYIIAIFIQDSVLIWRMYVVWGRSWKIILLPIIVELFHTACSAAALVGLSRPNTPLNSFGSGTLSSLGWPLELALNVLVTGAIVFRLWYMGRKVASRASGTRNNSYAAPIFTIIESGAILVIVTVIMLSLYKTGNPAALMVIDIATQVAALVPYLIIIRVSLGLTHGLPRAYRSYLETSKLESGMSFATNSGRRGRIAQVNIPVEGMGSNDTNDFTLSEFETALNSQENVKSKV